MDREKVMLAIGMGKPSEYPEFDAPEGLDLTDVPEGQETEVVAKIRKKPDGRLCLVSVNGVSLKEEEPEEENLDEEMDEETDADSYGDNNADSSGPDYSTSGGIGNAARAAGLM